MGERAFRREELKYQAQDYEKQREEDLKIYEQTKEETLKEAQEKHKQGLALKHRLARLVKHYDSFKGQITERRSAEFERLRKKAEREFEEEKQKRIRAVQERKIQERQEQEEEEHHLRNLLKCQLRNLRQPNQPEVAMCLLTCVEAVLPRAANSHPPAICLCAVHHPRPPTGPPSASMSLPI